MTKDDAFKVAALSVCSKIQCGAGVAVTTVKGKGGLLEGVVVGVSLLPSNVAEFAQMVDRWCRAKRFAASVVVIQ